MADDGRAMTQSRTVHTSAHRAPLPVVRAAVFALAGTVLGVSAHHLVAEGPAPWRQSGLAVMVLFGVGLAGVRRPRSLATVVATCAAAQTALHLWLTTAHAHGGATAPTALPAHLHHHAHEAWHERLHGSVTMTAVHAVAAFVLAVLLHRADTVCWSLARGLSAAADAVRMRIVSIRLAPAGSGPAVRWPSVLVLAWLERPPPVGAVLADVVVRRGPPRAGLVPAH